jgi:hypothetical protein
MLALVIWLVCAAPPAAVTAPTRDYADVAVQVTAEKLTVLNVQRGRFNQPTTLPRYRGRFAVRVLDGRKLLEEIRFDFPLLADAETDDAGDDARRFADLLRKGVSVKITVRVPLPAGAASLLVVDSKSNHDAGYSLIKGTAPSPSAAPRGAPPAR